MGYQPPDDPENPPVFVKLKTNNVLNANRIYPKDSVILVDPVRAKYLVEAKYADKHDGPAFEPEPKVEAESK